MHKFFCNYNDLTQRYELTKAQGFMFNSKVNIQAENSLLNQIKENIQRLYDLVRAIKENEQNENKLTALEETELLISNLYYSFFASPLEINAISTPLSGNELASAINLVSLLERDINIPEHNRLARLIKNNLQSLQSM